MADRNQHLPLRRVPPKLVAYDHNGVYCLDRIPKIVLQRDGPLTGNREPHRSELESLSLLINNSNFVVGVPKFPAYGTLPSELPSSDLKLKRGYLGACRLHFGVSFVSDP